MNSPIALSAPITYPPASLLGLPRELRDIIYGFAFDQSRDGRYGRLCVHEPPPEWERQQTRTVLALSLVNHQIHDEVLEDYYRDNTFSIMIGWYDVVDVVAGDRALFDVYLPTLNNPAAIQKLDILVNLEEPSREVCDWCLMRRLSSIRGQGSQFESLAEEIRRERDGNLKYSIKSEQAWQALNYFERCCEPRVKKVHKEESQTLWKTSSHVRKADQDLVLDPWTLFLPILKSLRISFTATRSHYYTSAQCLIGRVVVTFAKAFSKVPDFRFKVECWEGLPRNDEKVDRYREGESIDGISATSEAPLYWSCDPPLLMCGKVQQKILSGVSYAEIDEYIRLPIAQKAEHGKGDLETRMLDGSVWTPDRGLIVRCFQTRGNRRLGLQLRKCKCRFESCEQFERSKAEEIEFVMKLDTVWSRVAKGEEIDELSFCTHFVRRAWNSCSKWH